MSIMQRRLASLGLVVVAVAVVAAFLGSGLERDRAIAASPLIGQPAPTFELAGLNGPPVDLSDLRGQVVVMNFWASWCAECRIEQDALDRTWQRFQDSGVVVLGVNFQDQTEDARRYLAEAGTEYPAVRDAESSVSLAYGLRGVPETFLVDAQGVVVERFIGPVDEQVLEDRIQTLLDGATT
jgi:cytochrome c biogenesis protein CcmG/thiol:disulfide interchange protein DsbE